MSTYLSVIGTRPEIIKMAMLHHELRRRGHRSLVLHTGQHGDMADVLYRFFDMPPDLRADPQRRTDTLAHLTALLLEHVDHALCKADPDVVLVQGDTTSALVGALAAYYRGKPVAHVEAGLRTFAREPFPEEKNREIIGRLAHWHFPPTAQAGSNLLREGVSEGRLFVVGNTVIDAALWVRDRLREEPAAVGVPLPELDEFLAMHPHAPLLMVTAHRRENWGDPIRQVVAGVGDLLQAHPALVVVWPVHPNPRVRDDVETAVQAFEPGCRERLCLTQPLDYPALMKLLVRSRFALTDSGGILEEASAVRCPVLVTRESTERQELVDAGGARLVGCDRRRICEEGSRLLRDDAAWRSMQLEQSPFGDGRSAARIADILTRAVEEAT